MKQTAKQQFLNENQREGEIYAGIVLGKNGEPDYHLFKLPGEVERATWQDTINLVKSIGGESPNMRELALLSVNAREHFKDVAYWSCEQYAADSEYVWNQDFYNNYQYYDHKDIKLRGVAVRRVYMKEQS